MGRTQDGQQVHLRLTGLLGRLIGVAGLCVGAVCAAPGPGGGGGGAGIGLFPPAPLLAPAAVPPQFDITGFIQEATLDTAGTICQASDPRLAGGTLKVNGILVIVPCNTILQMPAATLTWQELFSLAPRDIGLPLGADGIPTQTGLALKDTVTMPLARAYGNGPLPSYEVHVQGNVVNGRYIAGLLFISQQSLNLGQGVITAIDYNNAELQIASKGPVPSVTRIKINDPSGRFGVTHGGPGSSATIIDPTFDSRFSVDAESPTIHSSTGYPMCIPRSDPFNDADDPLCPQSNRPRSPNCASLPDPFPAFTLPAAGQFCRTFMMPPPPATECIPAAGVTCPPDPRQQAPFEVGDFIDFMGTLKIDSKGSYISAHTIVANVGIYTTPGTMPAYVAIEMELQGTAALPIANLPQEATSRVKIEGFTTDPTNLVDIYAVDVDPESGATSDRLLGIANPSGPPVIGRFRFRPNAGAFLPPTRELRAVSRTLCGDPGVPCRMPATPQTYANGLIAGQYHAPNFEFIFAETLTLGDPTVPANFQDMAFLFCGSGPLTTPTAGSRGPVVRQLDPAPWDLPMPDPAFASTLCPKASRIGARAAPAPQAPATITMATASPATVTVGTKAIVTLSAAATDPNVPALAPLTYRWTGPAGVAWLNPTSPIATALFTATTVGPMNFTVTVSNGVTPPATKTVTVTVNPKVAPPRISLFAATPNTVLGGSTVVLTATASDLAGQPVTFSITQQGGPVVALAPIKVTGTAPAAQTATTNFKAPFGGPTQLTFALNVKNTGGATATQTVTVTVVGDTVIALNAAYDNRQGKGKFNVAATSTAITGLTPPPGMTMTAKFWNDSLPDNVPGSAAQPMSAAMDFVRDIPGLPPVCGTPQPCFAAAPIGVIPGGINFDGTPLFVPPTTVVIQSNLGGSATLTGARIITR